MYPLADLVLNRLRPESRDRVPRWFWRRLRRSLQRLGKLDCAYYGVAVDRVDARASLQRSFVQQSMNQPQATFSEDDLGQYPEMPKDPQKDEAFRAVQRNTPHTVGRRDVQYTDTDFMDEHGGSSTSEFLAQ